MSPPRYCDEPVSVSVVGALADAVAVAAAVAVAVAVPDMTVDICLCCLLWFSSQTFFLKVKVLL